MAEDAPLLRFKNQQLGGQVRARRDARERRARTRRAQGASATATAKDCAIELESSAERRRD